MVWFCLDFTFMFMPLHCLIWLKLWQTFGTVFVKILKRLSPNADLCIHSYWLSPLRQASHRKMIQSSALRLWLRHFKISSDTPAFSNSKWITWFINSKKYLIDQFQYVDLFSSEVLINTWLLIQNSLPVPHCLAKKNSAFLLPSALEWPQV